MYPLSFVYVISLFRRVCLYLLAMETLTKRKRHLKRDVTNYKDLLSVHCPVKQDKKVKTRLKSRREELYPTEIVERVEDKCVKFH